MRRLYGMPSRLTRWLNRNGWASASWIISAPPLEWPITGRRPVGDVVDHGHRVAQVAVPRVEVRVLAVAVAALVPRDHPPAGGGEHRREHVVRAGEVEAAVDEEQRRRVRVAPLVDRDAQPARRRSWYSRAGATAPGYGATVIAGMVTVPCASGPRTGLRSPPVNRTGLVALAGVLVGAAALGGGCGSTSCPTTRCRRSYTTTTTTHRARPRRRSPSARTYEIQSGRQARQHRPQLRRRPRRS